MPEVYNDNLWVHTTNCLILMDNMLHFPENQTPNTDHKNECDQFHPVFLYEVIYVHVLLVEVKKSQIQIYHNFLDIQISNIVQRVHKVKDHKYIPQQSHLLILTQNMVRFTVYIHS